MDPTLIGIGLVVLAAVIGAGEYAGEYVVPKIRAWANAPAEIGLVPPPKATSSDTPAPPGTREYVAEIVELTEGAPCDVRISYLMDGLSAAQVLRREVKRLRGAIE